MALKRIRNLFGKSDKSESCEETLNVRDSDVFLVSYPKSGNTWMRFLLINSLFNPERRELDYNHLEDYLPSVHRTPVHEINARTGQRIIKSHFLESNYPKIIYIVRDGRDALVSYFYFRRDIKRFEGDFHSFYYNNGVGKIGEWHEHVRNALAFKERNPKKIIIVKYEDLKEQTEDCMRKIVNFLGKQVTAEQLAFAISSSSFDSLQQMQKDKGVVIDDQNVNFFRQGKSNAWNSYFTEEMNRDFETKSREILLKLNYPIFTD